MTSSPSYEDFGPGAAIKMAKPRRYSHTALKMFQRCAKRWSYRYINRLEPAVKGEALSRGSDLHQMLEYYYSEEEWDLEEFTTENQKLIVAYDQHYGEEEWEIVSVEHEYEMTIGAYTLVFKPDLVVRINGEIWIVDHKTTVRIPDEYDEYNMTDFQHLLYIEGMKQNGYDVRGFLFNYIRTKAPTQPKLRKDGKIADLRRLDTDVPTLTAFAELVGLDTDPDVIDKLVILHHTANKFFQRHFILTNDHAVDEAVYSTVLVLEEMEIAERNEAYPRHVLPGWAGAAACSKCEFQGICQTEMLGMDVDLELLDLVVRPRRTT